MGNFVAETQEFVRQERRVRTEAKLLEAFETVLIREGVGEVTALAVAKEARVAKTLIYKYFDGIGGLIKSWAKGADLFVPLNVLFPDPAASVAELQNHPLQFAKDQVLKQAAHMRSNPAYVELCMAELSGSSPVVDALMELRRERNEAESQALGIGLDGSNVPMLLPVLLMPAAITYLAMRARKSPVYAGYVQLDTDEGWAQVMTAVEQLLDLIILAAKMSDLATTDQQALAEKAFNTNTES